MTWITPPSTGPEDWRKWRQRVARQVLIKAFPDGPPIGLTQQQLVHRARCVCEQDGLPEPGYRTFQRVLNGT